MADGNSGPLRLTMMTFPQHWDGAGTLSLNVLLIPSVDPVNRPLIDASPRSFASGCPTFEVHVQPGLDALPSITGPGVFVETPVITSAAAEPASTFKKLHDAVGVRGKKIGSPASLPPVTSKILKALPPSYLSAGGGPPDGRYTTTDDDFACAVRSITPPSSPPPPRTSVTWGELISYALRQPVLATKLGLRYTMTVTLPDSHHETLAAGGWVFVSLAKGDPWAQASRQSSGASPILVHAARLPPLEATARSLFAVNQFRVDGATGSLDRQFSTAETYADGFAKLVHCAQPANTDAVAGIGDLAPATDLGVQIGWDDEQVVTWHNDQLELLAAHQAGRLTGTRAPLGVLGYRVDVTDVTTTPAGGSPPPWQSLTRIRTQLPASLGPFTGELVIEPTPTRPSATAGGDAWLPRYFANWRGGSLCEPDTTPRSLTEPTWADKERANGHPAPAAPRIADGLTTLLSYGHTYRFRVRLADLSSGGPSLDATAVDAPPNAEAQLTFQRRIPPKAPIVEQHLQTPQDPVARGTSRIVQSLTIRRPLIGYPEVLYTRLGDTAASRETIRGRLVADATAAVAAIKNHTAAGFVGLDPLPTIAGLPDPDVDGVHIEVAIRHPLHARPDGGVYQTLYQTTRTLMATQGTGPIQTDPGTELPLVYVPAPNVLGWNFDQADHGPLLIPRGRDVRILVRARLRKAENYFAPEARPAMATTITVRCEPAAEGPLLTQAGAAQPLTGYLFRRPPDVPAPALVDHLAALLGVTSSGNSLTAPPGRRVVFGASAALRHTITSDGETLTFGSASDLLGRWIVAIVLDLARDWTWDGLTDNGINILRGAPTLNAQTSHPRTTPTAASHDTDLPSVGAMTIPRVLGPAATAKPSQTERGRTRLIFLDAIDPHEPIPADDAREAVSADSEFPKSLQHRWVVRPILTPAGPALAPSLPSPVLKPSPPPALSGRDFTNQSLSLRLPIAIPPAQVPAIASVGLAQAPFEIGPGYASTLPRQRAVWVELTAPIANQKGDALFARVLAHGADPLLYDSTLYDAPPPDVPEANPPLPLDLELVRIVAPDDTDDRAGLSAMTQLVPSTTSTVHFLLPLPPGVAADDPELFGFYSYEFRIGHAGPPGDLTWWSTANARFGAPLRVVGVQHPAPPLTCQASRFHNYTTTIEDLRREGLFPLNAVTTDALPRPPDAPGTEPGVIVASAPFATPVLNGAPLVTAFDDPPKTSLWFFVYAQVVQADGASIHNILLGISRGTFIPPEDLTGDNDPPNNIRSLLSNWLKTRHRRDRAGIAVFTQAHLITLLKAIHLPATTPLSVLAVEYLLRGTKMKPSEDSEDSRFPFDGRFPFDRILRASPLTPIPPLC